MRSGRGAREGACPSEGESWRASNGMTRSATTAYEFGHAPPVVVQHCQPPFTKRFIQHAWTKDLWMAAIGKLRLLVSRKTADDPAVAAPVVVAADDDDDLPIPSDIKAVFLGGLFLLAMLAACYVAA